ncbi:MAG: MFS transporter [Magnetococcales bacterium]|nr:MFS transporter [Magnetococcales bacterium]
MLHETIARLIPLFLALFVMMLGNGLYGSLVGLRATLEGFSASVTGVVLACFHLGAISGAWYAPVLIRRMSHLTVLRLTLATLGAVVLLHGLLVHPIAWGGLRIVGGFAMFATGVAAESWIQLSCGNAIRGRVFGAYLAIEFSALGMGQFMLEAADPTSDAIFLWAGIPFVLALLPLSLSRPPIPAAAEFVEHPALDVGDAPPSVAELFRSSPTGFIAAGLSGALYSILFGMGTVYALGVGLPNEAIAWFIALMFMGGGLGNWPMGRLSDLRGRGPVLRWSAWGAVALAGLGGILPEPAAALPALYLIAFLLGWLILPQYGIGVSMINDRLTPSRRVAAQSRLLTALAVCAMSGPMLAGPTLDQLGPGAWFGLIALCNGLIALTASFSHPPMEKPAPRAADDVDGSAPAV